MKKKKFSVAQLIGDEAFISKVEDAIFTTMPDNENGKVVKVNSFGFTNELVDGFERLIVNATVNSQTLSFTSAIDTETGFLIGVGGFGLTASCKGYNWQYDSFTKSLVGGYSADGFSFQPDFWLNNVAVSDVQSAIEYCESKANETEIIVGDWQQLKNA